MVFVKCMNYSRYPAGAIQRRFGPQRRLENQVVTGFSTTLSSSFLQGKSIQPEIKKARAFSALACKKTAL